MVCINCELKPITILISTTSKAKGIFSKGTSNSQQSPIDGSFALNTKLYKDQNPETVSKLNDSGQRIHSVPIFFQNQRVLVKEITDIFKILSENLAF